MATETLYTSRESDPDDTYFVGTKEQGLPPLPMNTHKVEALLVQIMGLTLTEYQWLRKRLDDAV